MKRVMVFSLLLVLLVVFPLSACTGESAVLKRDRRESESEAEIKQRTPDPNGEWDELLLNCEGKYFVVKKTVETYNSVETEVGVADIDNNWVRPLSAENELAKFIVKESGKTAITGQTTSVNPDNFYYLGNGLVVGSLGVHIITETMETVSVGGFSGTGGCGLCCYLYNIEQNRGFEFDAVEMTTVLDGHVIFYDYGGFSTGWYRIDDNGSNLCGFVAIRGPYSEGLFLGTPDTNWAENEFGFYDINGTQVIDLTQFDIQNEETTKFENGICEIYFNNPAGHRYCATIDREGNFVVEPHSAN